MPSALTFPTDEQIARATTWLRLNEGKDGEADDCAAVADWLEAEAADRLVKSMARKQGVPVAAVRRRLAEIGRSA